MPDTAATLLLPGMTLNGTIFSGLPQPARSVDFSTLVLSHDGRPPNHPVGPMGPHLDALDTAVHGWDAWTSAKTRVAIGHSFGGMLLLKWLIERRDTLPLDGAVLIATTAGPMFDSVRLRVPFGLRLPVKPALPAWNHPVVTRLCKRIWTGGTLAVRPVDFQTLSNRSDASVDRSGWRNTDWRSMRSFRFACDGYDVRSDLDEIKIPVTVLHGSRDSLFLERAAETLASRMPLGTFVGVPGAGHALPLTHPEVVTGAHQSLLARIVAEPRCD